MRHSIYITIIWIGCLLRLQAQQDFTVVIDPGHGGKDPGSIGKTAKEKTINLAVALQLGEIIARNHNDVKVIYTRKTDVFIPLDERANIANKQKADLFISIHANSVKRGLAKGTETYTLGLDNSTENLDVAMRENSVITLEEDYLRKYEGFDPHSTESYIIFEFIQSKHMEQSVSLASEVQKAFVQAKRPNRGVKQAGLLVLRKTGMPSVLIELGFISDRTEERYMASKEGQNVLSQAIYKAFANYKNNYDRRRGYNNVKPPFVKPAKAKDDDENSDGDKNAGSRQPSQHNKNKSDDVVYKIQILTSDKKLPPSDKCFKGYDNISYYVEKNIYKYTYGATTDYKQIQTLLKQASKDFKGAFIIKTKDGKRLY